MKRAVAYCRVSTKGQVGDDKYGIDADGVVAGIEKVLERK